MKDKLDKGVELALIFAMCSVSGAAVILGYMMVTGKVCA